MKTQSESKTLSESTAQDTEDVLRRRIHKLEVDLTTEERNYAYIRAQRDELLAALKGALAAISQPVTMTRARAEREYVRAYNILNADCETAREWMRSVISKAESEAGK